VHPAFPTPSVFLGEKFQHASGASRREIAKSYPKFGRRCRQVTLIVIPVIFGVVKGFGLPREDRIDGRLRGRRRSQSSGLNPFRNLPDEPAL
jgi:hypothetical protein